MAPESLSRLQAFRDRPRLPTAALHPREAHASNRGAAGQRRRVIKDIAPAPLRRIRSSAGRASPLREWRRFDPSTPVFLAIRGIPAAPKSPNNGYLENSDFGCRHSLWFSDLACEELQTALRRARQQIRVLANLVSEAERSRRAGPLRECER